MMVRETPEEIHVEEEVPEKRFQVSRIKNLKTKKIHIPLQKPVKEIFYLKF